MAVVAGSLLLAVFGPGAKDVADIVKTFDFGSMDVRDETNKNYLHTDLAPSYGTLTSHTLQGLDEDLKIMIAGTMKLLAKQEDRSWQSVLATMMQNPLLETDGATIDRSDMFIRNESNDFKVDGSPDPAIVRQVETWFTKLIADEDVLKSTKIDLPVMANIVAQSGATIDNFLTFFAKHERHSKHIVDIGVLRFPDIDHPHFKLYRIQLDAWSDSSRILFHQEDKNGITGVFTCRKFKPRKSVIDNLEGRAREAAVKEANNLFA